MVGSKTCAFSWADEVEKEEEEEEAHAHLLQQQKPNPFGSARPREIVLEERGIDWRNLNHELQSSDHRKLKNQSKPVPPMPASIERKGQFSIISNGFEQNTGQIQNVRNVHDNIVPSSAYLNQQKQNTVPSAPPLRYPPKNVLYVMEEMQRFQNSNRMRVGPQNLPYERHLRELDLERENVISVHMRRNLNNIETIKTPHRGGEKENMEFRYGRKHDGKGLISPPVEPLANEGRWRVTLNGKMEKAHFRNRRVQSVNKGGTLEGEFERRGHFDSNTEGAYFGGRYERDGRSVIEEGYSENMVYESMSTSIQERAPYNLNIQSRGFGDYSRKRGMTSTPEIFHCNQRRRR